MMSLQGFCSDFMNRKMVKKIAVVSGLSVGVSPSTLPFSCASSSEVPYFKTFFITCYWYVLFCLKI